MSSTEPVDIPRRKRGTSASYYPVDVMPMDGGVLKGDGVNPDPILATDSSQDLMFEEYLSPRRLRELTGVDNLDEVEYLELRVNTSETTLGNFGILVPNLKDLKLTGSSIQSVRDLGSSLDNLQTLWMATTGLQDIDGLSSMCNLRELYLAFNDISDLSPCSMLDDLRILDLEGNQLDDISQVEFLSLCTKLAELTLRGNPFCEKMTNEDYRNKIFSILPNLKNLDDKQSLENSKVASPRSVKDETTKKEPPKAPGNPFTEDWNLINQFVREGTIGTDSVLTDSGYSSVTSPANTAVSNGRSATARPQSAARPFTSSFRPMTSIAQSRPMTSRGLSPTLSSLNIEDDTADGDTSSSSLLTKGPVLCGNPSRALRRRREFVSSASSREDTMESNRSSLTASPNHVVIGPENANLVAASYAGKNERIGSVASLGERGKSDVGSLLKDIDKWRSDYQVGAVQRLKEQGKPNILVVQQGSSLSDDEEEDDILQGSDSDGSLSKEKKPISPRPPNIPKPLVSRRQPPPAILVPAMPLPASTSSLRPNTSNTSASSRMSSKIQYVSTKHSQ